MTLKSHWETSTRSLYVRTVWINGVRHAILSKNDPLAAGSIPKRPYSCSTIQEPKRKNRSLSNSNDYTQTVSVSTNPSESPTEDLSEIEYKFDLSIASDEEDLIDHFQEKCDDFRKCKRQSSCKKINLPHVKTNSFRENQPCYGYLVKNQFINPITERVLNWLDLASKEANGSNSSEDIGKETDNRTNKYQTGGTVAAFDEMNERNRAWERSIHSLEEPTLQAAGEIQCNRGSVRNASENTIFQKKIGHTNDIDEMRQLKNDPAPNRRRKLHSSFSQESVECRPSTTNLLLDFAAPHIRVDKQLKPKTNAYAKQIRKNEDLIRRNNENISKLARNINEFQRTNEIVCRTKREGNEHCKANTSKHSRTSNGQSPAHDNRGEENIDDEDRSNIPRIDHKDNKTVSSKNDDKYDNKIDLNNNIDKGLVEHRKHRHRRGRKGKSRRRSSSKDDEERWEDKSYDIEEYEDTIRYIIMRDSDYTTSTIRHPDPTRSTFTPLRSFEPIRMGPKLNDSKLEIPRFPPDKFVDHQRYTIHHNFPKTPNDSTKVHEEGCLNHQYSSVRGFTNYHSKPQLHIFMPRFQNFTCPSYEPPIHETSKVKNIFTP